uniref:Uncharacterized protein n=1 Tax=Astyanax mexicanus TaxID=7994 RepID=A0A3B1IP50_ASTMX
MNCHNLLALTIRTIIPIIFHKMESLSCYTDHLFVAVKQSVCFNYTGWCYNKQWEEARIVRCFLSQVSISCCIRDGDTVLSFKCVSCLLI